MRILFQMPFPGYLRMYGSTIRLLADRDHHVLLSYDRPDKRRDAAATAFEEHASLEVVAPLPAARRRHEPAIAQLGYRVLICDTVMSDGGRSLALALAAR